MRQNNVAYMELWLLLLVRKHKELSMKNMKISENIHLFKYLETPLRTLELYWYSSHCDV